MTEYKAGTVANITVTRTSGDVTQRAMLTTHGSRSLVWACKDGTFALPSIVTKVEPLTVLGADMGVADIIDDLKDVLESIQPLTTIFAGRRAGKSNLTNVWSTVCDLIKTLEDRNSAPEEEEQFDVGPGAVVRLKNNEIWQRSLRPDEDVWFNADHDDTSDYAIQQDIAEVLFEGYRKRA